MRAAAVVSHCDTHSRFLNEQKTGAAAQKMGGVWRERLKKRCQWAKGLGEGTKGTPAGHQSTGFFEEHVEGKKCSGKKGQARVDRR